MGGAGLQFVFRVFHHQEYRCRMNVCSVRVLKVPALRFGMLIRHKIASASIEIRANHAAFHPEQCSHDPE
jgi:hypothetical protein